MQVFKSVDDYIAAQPEDLQPKLKQIRQIIKKAAPKAEEGIGYGMPAYKLAGPLVYFANFKNHFGFFPTPGGVDAFKNELAAYETSKGTVRFPQDKALPIKLISDIVKFRVIQNEEKAASKAAAKKSRK